MRIALQELVDYCSAKDDVIRILEHVIGNSIKI